ncbi:MAG: hypothetical protein J6S53_10035 [Lentisphaeria bacterium]|nr:hypothetical protein [Lentisphaeria bacterium]
MAFHYYEDFQVRDELKHSYGIDIENHSNYTHGHAQIFEPGKYQVTLDGNKHFLNTPPLKDFSMEMDFTLYTHRIQFGYGFQYYFRYDRKLAKGHNLKFSLDQDHNLMILLDEKVIGKRVFIDFPPMENMKVKLAVNGNTLSTEVFGRTYTGIIEEKNYPEKGEVGFDLLFAPGGEAVITSIKLDSPDDPKKKLLGKKLEFILSQVQGMTEPARYEAALYDYGNGYVVLDCTLAGTVRNRPERIKNGGKGWCYEYERMTDPYIRIESNGKEFLNVYFFNGEYIIFDQDEKVAENRAIKFSEIPRKMQVVCRNFPKEYIVAAGYAHLCHKPWCFVENGPWEQIRDMNNNFLYEGPSLRKNLTGIKVFSPEDKMLVSRIPKKIPMYAEAVKHAKEQHYFYDDEKVDFTVGFYFRKKFYSVEELTFECEIQDPFERAVPGISTKVKKGKLAAKNTVSGDFGCTAWNITLNKFLKSGVYHLKMKVTGGGMVLYDDWEVFEILPEDPDAVPPPVASGLPFMLSMNNEVYNLETDAFDPLSGWGGAGHYYSMVMRYPIIGKKLKIWEILKVYHRKWFLMLTGRNTNDTTLSESNKELIRHADYVDIGAKEFGLSDGSPYLFRTQIYFGVILEFLRDFLKEHKVKCKKLTIKDVEAIIRKNEERAKLPENQGKPIYYWAEYLPHELFDDLVSSCWNEWIKYVLARVKKGQDAFIEKILAINPAIARGSYGPTAIYAQNYRSIYSARYALHGNAYDDKSNKNGSFYFLEDYHLSCDYPISKASFFIASYKLVGKGRKYIYPEIYYGGGVGCLDGAVYQAHPPFGIYEIEQSHQRTIAYTFAYATPFFKNGKFDYWRDHGFHCPTPRKDSFRHFLHAWGNMKRNEPLAQLPAPFMFFDMDLFDLHGSYNETEHNYNPCEKVIKPWTDVDNTAEEALAFTHICLTSKGWNTPVLSDIASIGKIPENTPYIILPPIHKGTPEKFLKGIREAHRKGIGILAFEYVEGLEDLFGVKKRKKVVNVKKVGTELFKHKMANCRYESAGADVMLYGAENIGDKADIPLVFAHETKYGRTVLFNVPPTTVKREDYRAKLGAGQATISQEMKDAMENAACFLDKDPAVRSEHGMINSCLSVNGDVIVTICGCPTFYSETDTYPKAFRFKVRYPGIENAEIESDVPCGIAEKGKGYVVIRSVTDRDTGLFYRFILPKKK